MKQVLRPACQGVVVCIIAAIRSPAGADTVRGTVIDRATRAPVAGAVVAIGSELAATEDDGSFTIEVAAGRYTIEVSAPWLVTTRRPIELRGELVVELAVERAEQIGGERIDIVDIAPTQLGESRVDAKLARAVPGGGDAAKVVQSLPAVARPPAGSAEIVVWGAAPRDTRVFVDGVPVPALYHLGGYRAAVGNDLIGDVRLTPAAFGPDRGRAIGGVIDIGFAPPGEAPRWRIQADPLDVGAAASGAVGAIELAAAARYSWLDRAVDAVADPQRLAPNAPLPRWSDAQWAFRSALAERVVASGWVIGSLDQLDRRLASDDPATETVNHIDQRWVRGQLSVRRDRAAGSDSATLWFGADRTRDELAVGTIAARQRATQWVGGARARQESLLAPHVALAIGLDLEGEAATLERVGSLAIPAREGDPHIFGQPPGDDVAADRWNATTVDGAGYGALDLRWRRVTATVGGRIDTWMLAASRLTPRVGATPGIASQLIDWTFDPRASLQIRIDDRAGLRVDLGRYHQARAASDTSAVFGTPALGLEQAWHATIGGQWQRAPLAIEAALYARLLDDLVARDPAVTPRLAHVLTQDGNGRVFGAQLTARIIGWHGLSGWISYGLSRSTRRDAATTPERLFDRDQTHGLIAVGGYARGRWTCGVRMRVATGEPRTDVVGALFDSRSGRFQPIRGEPNGVRLPSYFAADLRGERSLAVAARARAALYAEIQNITARANAEEIIYSADYTMRDYLTSLPLVVVIGARIEQ